MGSWFLNPWFLAGLTVLGVPVWIHLIRSRRDRPQPFPSLMFLERVPLHAAKRQRLRDIPLLLLRLAALLLLVLAFARPVGTRGDAAAGARQARDVVLLLDTSWSMAYEGVWDQAQEAVGREIGSL